LDENLAEAHTLLASVAVGYDWNWPEAEKGFRRAIILNPNYATAHHWYGMYLDTVGRFEEALLELYRALELEPMSLAINTSIGRHYCFARQYKQAAKQLTTTLEMNPDFAYAHWVLEWSISRNRLLETQ